MDVQDRISAEDLAVGTARKLFTIKAPSTHGEILKRIIIIGTSCAGKSTFASRLAQTLGLPHVELDELFWAPNWKPKSEAEFRCLVSAATTNPEWIVDGNYGSVRDRVDESYCHRVAKLRFLHRIVACIFALYSTCSSTRENMWRKSGIVQACIFFERFHTGVGAHHIQTPATGFRQSEAQQGISAS
ncbi:MAG TPA: hypothetical protein VFW00_07955 [Rhodocyclaceae bacterium]|nr:hypothetical protein [Rhodocyclaceae bacterium]